jgi:integrase
MATLYRKKSPTAGKDLPNWYCFFRVPSSDGTTKQIHRSTGRKTKKEALEVANAFERETQKEAGADDSTATAILAKISEAGELALKGRLNPAHARRIIGEIMEVSGELNLVNRTCREWFAEWLAEKKVSTKPATVAFYKSTTKDFLAFLGERADKHIEAITSQDIRAFRDSVVKKGRTAKTANHKLKCLRSVFGDAVKVSALLHNPAAPVKQLDEKDSTPRLPFTAKEVSGLVKAAPSADWKGLILLGAFAGMRLGDASTLKAGNVDLARSVLQFTPQKTDRKRKVVEMPLHPELQAFFNEIKLSPFPGTPIFPTLEKVTPAGRNGLSAKFRAIMEEAKVDRHLTRRTADGAARDTASRSFHSLRHTFTSMLANADVPEEVRMRMTGHTETTTHQIYTSLEIETLRSGLEKIPNLAK